MLGRFNMIIILIFLLIAFLLLVVPLGVVCGFVSLFADDEKEVIEPHNITHLDNIKPWEIEEIEEVEENPEILSLKNDLENAKLKLKDLNELYDLILGEYDQQEEKKPSTLNKLITLNDKIHKQEKIIIKLSETLENET